MTVHAAGKVENFKGSIELYISTNLVTTESLTVDFEGKHFESDQLTEWIRERLLIPEYSFFGRNVDKTNIGQLSTPIINFNILVDKQQTDKTNRHYEIRDILFKYFYPGVDIDLYDFSSSDFTNSIQKMRLREIVTDMALPDEDNYFNYNFSISVDWLQKWS